MLCSDVDNQKSSACITSPTFAMEYLLLFLYERTQICYSFPLKFVHFNLWGGTLRLTDIQYSLTLIIIAIWFSLLDYCISLIIIRSVVQWYILFLLCFNHPKSLLFCPRWCTSGWGFEPGADFPIIRNPIRSFRNITLLLTHLYTDKVLIN